MLGVIYALLIVVAIVTIHSTIVFTKCYSEQRNLNKRIRKLIDEFDEQAKRGE